MVTASTRGASRASPAGTSSTTAWGDPRVRIRWYAEELERGTTMDTSTEAVFWQGVHHRKEKPCGSSSQCWFPAHLVLGLLQSCINTRGGTMATCAIGLGRSEKMGRG